MMQKINLMLAKELNLNLIKLEEVALKLNPVLVYQQVVLQVCVQLNLTRLVSVICTSLSFLMNAKCL